MKRLRHLPIVWGPTSSRVATMALLGSRSQASTIFARSVSAAGSERDRVIAKRWVRSSLDIVSIAFDQDTRNRCNNYAANLRDRTLVLHRRPRLAPTLRDTSRHRSVRRLTLGAKSPLPLQDSR